jgi:hypothetical protein
MTNPYRWSQINLDLIYGRAQLLDEMLKALPTPNGNSFGITGARRMGKTTVLRAIERDLLDGSEIWSESGTSLVIVYLDGLALPRPLTAGFIWGEIWAKVSQALLPEASLFRQEIAFSDFVDFARCLYEKHPKVPKIVVIFDEIEHIIATDWATSFFANWRALLSNYPGLSGCFSAVFSGALEMAGLQHDVGSPLMDVLEWRSLRSLSTLDCSRLMREPLKLEISPACVARVFEETGGHPMIVQYVMRRAVDSGCFSESGAESAIADFCTNRAWQFSEWWFKYCDDTSRLIYRSLPGVAGRAIASLTQEIGGYAASKGLEILQHVGIIAVDDDCGLVKKRGLMFTRWQAENGVDADGMTFDAELANHIEILDVSMREKYISAWAIYSKDMPNYSGAVSEMRDLITLTLHHLAPDERVMGVPSFKLERDQTRPTRRQRIMFIFATRKDQGKSVASDDELIELHSNNLARIVSTAYASASALTHTTATRPLAYQSLKQGESILIQLISAGALGNLSNNLAQ